MSRKFTHARARAKNSQDSLQLCPSVDLSRSSSPPPTVVKDARHAPGSRATGQSPRNRPSLTSALQSHEPCDAAGPASSCTSMMEAASDVSLDCTREMPASDPKSIKRITLSKSSSVSASGLWSCALVRMNS